MKVDFNPQFQAPKAASGKSNAQEAQALEKDIARIKDKLVSLQKDMEQYQSDGANGGTGTDEMLALLRQEYQRLTAELETKQTQLQDALKVENVSAENTAVESANKAIQESLDFKRRFDRLELETEEEQAKAGTYAVENEEEGFKIILE